MAERFGIATYGASKFEVQDLKLGRKVEVFDSIEQAQDWIDSQEAPQGFCRRCALTQYGETCYQCGKVLVPVA